MERFIVSSPPSSAMLELRAFKWAEVTLNGRPVQIPATVDWKEPSRVELIALLLPGTNSISVVVSNDFGPPALSLSIKTDQVQGPLLVTGPAWGVSHAGGSWQAAALASAPPIIRPGNDLYGWPAVGESLRRSWLTVLLVMVGSGLLLLAFRFLARLELPPGPNLLRWLRDPANGALAICLLAWVLLMANNLRQVPPLHGFDRDGHLDYINFILDKGSLPLASDGWQMYQPPLYYILSAALLFPGNLNASSDAAVLTLRVFTSVIGLTNILLVFVCLRLVFPDRRSAQAVGTLMAGFLPAHLYMSHHVTNEILAATLATASIYLTLRALRSDARMISFAAGAGACLGLSLLAKFSAVLFVPLMLFAFAWRIEDATESETPRKSVRVRLRFGAAVVALAAVFITCGWHYARVWQHFGNPLIGNWDRALPFAWWQEPGYRTAGYYTGLGHSFLVPVFSSIHSFWDGLYSSLWGDALASGASRYTFRPPWNYDLGNAGYLLAIIPMALILAGFLRVLIRFVRRPDPQSGLFTGVSFAFLFGLAYMTVRVPSYAQVKAVYALPLFLPLCAFAVYGWEWFSARWARGRGVLAVFLVAWAGCVFATSWIRSWDPHTYVALGISYADEGNPARALTEFQRALELDPASLAARAGLASTLQAMGRLPEAQAQIASSPLTSASGRILREGENAELLFQSAALAIRQRDSKRAIAILEELAEQAPDHPSAWRQLAVCLALEGREQEALRAREQALRINPYDAQQHQQQADLLSRRNDPGSAIRHYRFALTLQPDHAETLNNLAWILATATNEKLRDGVAATKLARHACELTRYAEPVFLGTLAACLAETGEFENATSVSGQAIALADSAGRPEVAETNRRLQALYRLGKTVRGATPQ